MLPRRFRPASVLTQRLRDSGTAAMGSDKPREEPRLALTETEIGRVARRMGPAGFVAVLGWRATRREWWLRIQRQINFRRSNNDEALQAYQAMRIADFIDINGLQAWANWRAIPRNLNGQLPDRPVFAIDLCSGIGDSTAVLAYYCAPGSEIMGLEFNLPFVEHARRRSYWNRDHRPANVSFVVQNVLETWQDRNGRTLSEGRVDLVNAVGAVGCHFDRDAVRSLASECRRVVRPGGLALIDVGRGGIRGDELADSFHSEGFRCIGQARGCCLDLGRQLCLQRSM